MASIKELLMEAALWGDAFLKAEQRKDAREAEKIKQELLGKTAELNFKIAQAKKKTYDDEQAQMELKRQAEAALMQYLSANPGDKEGAFQVLTNTMYPGKKGAVSQIQQQQQQQQLPKPDLKLPDKPLAGEARTSPGILQETDSRLRGQAPQDSSKIVQLPSTSEFIQGGLQRELDARYKAPPVTKAMQALPERKPAPRPVTKATPPPVTTAVTPTAKVVEPSQPKSYQQMVEDQLKQLTKEAPVGPPADLDYPSSQELFVQDYINKLTDSKIFKTPAQQRQEIKDKAEQYTKWRKGETDHLQSVLTITKLAKDLDAPPEPDYISHSGSLWVTTPEGIQEIIPGPDMKFIKTVEDESGTMMAMYEDWSTGFLKVVYAPVTQLIEKELGKPGKELKVKVPGKKEYKIIGGKSYLFEDGKKPVLVEEWPEPMDPVDQSAIDQIVFDNTSSLQKDVNANPRLRNINTLMNQFSYMHTAMETIDQITDENVQVMAGKTEAERTKIAKKVKYITDGSEDKWEAAGITSPNASIQTILVTFQKILDPTSVVRESEYARSPQGVSALRRIEGFIQKLIIGGAVSVSEVREIYLLAEKFYQNARVNYAKVVLPYFKRAARNQGIKVDEVFDLEVYDLFGLKYDASKKEIMDFIDQINNREIDLKTLLQGTNPYEKRAITEPITPVAQEQQKPELYQQFVGVKPKVVKPKVVNWRGISRVVNPKEEAVGK